jgi:hypothetical protein
VYTKYEVDMRLFYPQPQCLTRTFLRASPSDEFARRDTPTAHRHNEISSLKNNHQERNQ